MGLSIGKEDRNTFSFVNQRELFFSRKNALTWRLFKSLPPSCFQPEKPTIFVDGSSSYFDKRIVVSLLVHNKLDVISKIK